MRLQNPCCIWINDRCFYSRLSITPDLWCQKRLRILCSSTTSIKIWRSGASFAFSPFIHLSEPLRKQKVVVRDLWLVNFDPFCVFLCSKVRCFVFEKHRKFYLSSNLFNFVTLKHASLDSTGEIVPIQLPNPEEAQQRKGENEPVRSRWHLHLLTNTVDATYGNGLIDVAEKFEFGACSVWIVEDVGRGSFLFPTYLGRSKETLFAG